MKKCIVPLWAGFMLIATASLGQSYSNQYLDELPLTSFSNSLRPVMAKANYMKDTIHIGKQAFLRGIGAITPSVLPFVLNGKAKRFKAFAGVDDLANKDIPLSFFVLGDGRILFEKKNMRLGDAAVEVSVDLTGVQRLGLLITDTVGGVGNKKTYANWANARIEMLEGFQPEQLPNEGKPYILTPAPGKFPKINSPKLFGARPRNPFLYTIAATGDKPLRFEVSQLPKGLFLSPLGSIAGTVEARGNYEVKISVSNRWGVATQKLKIVIGDTIALTPPMGWNGWNSWESDIDQEKVLASAKAMVDKGLKDHGWSYINIDDTWQGLRTGPDTSLQPNQKFPDIKGMVDAIHAMGLKAGIYSTPYIASYGGYVGASSDFPTGGETHDLIKVNRPPFSRIGPYKFENNDARQMAAWGFDFLKYDWRIDVASTQRMADALKNSGRDIVYSLSNNAPFEKVEDWRRLSNMYRTGPDIKDNWTSLFINAFSLDKWSPYTGPGHWADPDMMILGDVSIGPVMHPTKLTPDEQYSHVSIFSLLAAPMLIGCPIEKLDSFTLSLLSNDEVIAINQDPLGKAARLRFDQNGIQVWVKELEDGAAIGIFNNGGYGKTPASYFRWGNERPVEFTLDLNALGFEGSWAVRDLWRQKKLGRFAGKFSTSIPYHGVVMLKMTK
jgi:alpha-galactosidase